MENSFKVEGILYKIMETEQVNDKFKKRYFVLEVIDGAYTQLIQFQLIQDKCKLLDNFQLGNNISVSFNLRGREWKNNSDEIKYFTNLDAWRIDPVGSKNTNGKVTVETPITAQGDGGGDLPF